MRDFNISIYYDDDMCTDAVDLQEIGISFITKHSRYTTLGTENISGDIADHIMYNMLEFNHRQIGWLENKFGGVYNNHALKYLLNRLDKQSALLNVYMCEHSDTSISTTPFGCKWDSGQLGFIYVSDKNQFCKQFQLNQFSRDRAKEVMQNHITYIDHILKGHTYGYEITDSSGTTIDCCGGFVGDLDSVREDMLCNIAIGGTSDIELEEKLSDALSGL